MSTCEMQTFRAALERPLKLRVGPKSVQEEQKSHNHDIEILKYHTPQIKFYSKYQNPIPYRTKKHQISKKPSKYAEKS